MELIQDLWPFAVLLVVIVLAAIGLARAVDAAQEWAFNVEDTQLWQ